MRNQVLAPPSQPQHSGLGVSSFRFAYAPSRRRRRSSGATSVSAATTARDVLSQLRSARDRTSAIEERNNNGRRMASTSRMTANGRHLVVPDRITTFTLFTPIPLTHTPDFNVDEEDPGLLNDDVVFTAGARASNGRRRRRRRRRPGAPVRGYTQQRVDTGMLNADHTQVHSSKVLNTTSFNAVRQRLYTLRKSRIQEDNVEADLGNAGQKDPSSQDLPAEQSNEEGLAQAERMSEPQVTFLDDDYDDEDGDLSLPPPALDLPTSILDNSAPITPRRVNQVASRTGEQDKYMSDVPLTPRVQMAKAMEFSRGFEAQRSIANAQSLQYSPILEGNEEQVNEEVTQGTFAEMQRSQSHLPQVGATNSGSSDPQTAVPSPASGPGQTDESMHAAWWLDVTCPTYETMTELSQMFPLHPLTVEDVLMQEPREKIEIFDRLGYYF